MPGPLGNYNSFNLASLYQQVWGHGTTSLTLPKNTDNQPVASLEPGAGMIAKDTRSDSVLLLSELGTPFYEAMQNDPLGREYYLPVTLGGLKLSTAILRISSRKTIVETALVNRRGTVKELINIEDYNIRLRGFFISDTRELPDRQINELRKLYETNRSVDLRCALSDIFLTDEDKVVIKSLELPEVKGVKNVRPYELEMASDREFELIIKDDSNLLANLNL